MTAIVEDHATPIPLSPEPAGWADHIGKFAHLLLPTDLSSALAKALPCAIALARKPGGKLTILHATPPRQELVDFGYGPVWLSKPDDLEAVAAHKKLRRIERKFAHPDVEIQTSVVSGKPVEVITEAARKLGVDGVLLLLHSQDSGESIPEHLLRSLPCPVIAFKV